MRTALVLVFLAACVEKGPAVDENFVKQNLLSVEPTPKHAVNADLGGKIVYLGLDVDKETLKPGEQFTLTHYWKVIQPPGTEWRTFTHLRGQGKDWMNVDGSKMRANHGPEKWKAGEIIRDEQKLTLKSDWSSPFVTVNLGLYKKGSSNPKDRIPVVSGPKDGDGGVLVVRLPVAGRPQPQAHPDKGYVIKKASGAITVDGKADEAAWKDAQVTSPFKTAEGGQAPGGDTTAKLLWDEKNLYVFFDIKDKDVFSEFTKNDDTLWKADVVEMFIDANGDKRGYVELQVNPNNAQFDSFFAGGNRQQPNPTWSAMMESAVQINGTKDKRDDTDIGWTAEIAIPLQAVKGMDTAMAVNLPPKPGDKWKLNAVRVEKPKDAKQVTASSWAQITIQDFHAIDKLMEVTFGDEKGQTKAAGAVDPKTGTAAPAGSDAGGAAPDPRMLKVNGVKRGAPGTAPSPAPAKAPDKKASDPEE